MLYFISMPYKILNIITNNSEKMITAGEIPREIYVVVCCFFSKSLQSKTQIHSNLHKCVFLCIFCQFLMEYIHI